MELREFAEQVLLGTTLAEKLTSPEHLTDDRPGPPLATPAAPGRPTRLQFKPHATGKSDFPGLHRLEAASERGKLLHFFGNHELLATELMALVLLKFPDAPPAFRKGVLQTLRDEQEHTRLYLERMHACGVEFGDLPVSGYFWRCVAPMEHPIDYVASLCLTFEQANLDFAGHYARSFATVGDAASAALLKKIYRDEIGHVAYGLKWFRRWKNPDESDWDAFCRTLKFPLSPQRAKGFALNIAGRRAAGLGPQFIAQLDVYSQSKGRTPSVFVFNAFTEGRLAEGRAFNPTKLQAQLALDLENLPQFLCRQDDIVLTRRKPSVEFLSRIKQAGFPLPEFVELERSAGPRPGSVQGENSSNQKSSRIQLLNHPPIQRIDLAQTRKPFLPLLGERAGVRASSFQTNFAFEVQGEVKSGAVSLRRTGAPGLREVTARKLGSLRPWAWGPDSVELLKPLFASVTGERRDDAMRFNPGLAQLYAKSWSADFLRAILSENSDRGWLCSENEIGVAVNSLDAARSAIAAIRARGHHRVVVKQSFGVAGSQALRLWEPEILEKQWRWLEQACARQRELVVEPWLERVGDFSVQLEMTPAGLKRCGFTGLITDARGQFVANYAEAHHHTRLPARVVSQFREPADVSRRLLDFYERLRARLEIELRAVDFLGPLGLDAFIYRDASGGVRLKPVVEINPRYTMGRVLVELMRQTCQNCAGLFRLVNAAQLRAQGFANFPDYARALEEKYPLQLEGDPAPRIREGVLCLNDPDTAQTCLALFQVSRRLDDLLPPDLPANRTSGANSPTG